MINEKNLTFLKFSNIYLTTSFFIIYLTINYNQSEEYIISSLFSATVSSIFSLLIPYLIIISVLKKLDKLNQLFKFGNYILIFLLCLALIIGLLNLSGYLITINFFYFIKNLYALLNITFLLSAIKKVLYSTKLENSI